MILKLLPSSTEMQQAFYRKDATYDGVFFVAVRTTGIFCRPSCSSRPKPENIEFFPTIRDAIFAGYRPCNRCNPLLVYGALPDWVTALMQRQDAPDGKITAADLQSLGTTPERVRRWFQANYGMTFIEWCRGRRLANAFTQIRNGAAIDDVVFANQYESHSGFREAFSKAFGVPPGAASQNCDFVAMQVIETPLGAMFVGAVREGICSIEYADRQTLQRKFGYPVLPVTNDHIEHLRDQLSDYFAGKLTEFSIPLVPQGTSFQKKVWAELQQIPYRETISYDQLAQRINQPTAVRAVARANAMNRINILIPCHRVIGKDGQLTGYGGGLWRKRLLIELERTGKLPGDTDNLATL